MRIIQPCGPSHRDDGAPLYIKKYLNRIPGVTCERKSMHEPPEKWGETTAIVYVDWGQDNFAVPPVRVPKDLPSLCWQSDTHWTPHAREYRFRQSLEFTRQAFAQRDAAHDFDALYPGHAVRWMPHAADHGVYTPMLSRKMAPEELACDPASALTWPIAACLPTWDACFVGHIGDAGRIEKLERLFAAVPNFNFRPQTFFEEAAEVYHHSAVSFNTAVRGELNMRTFEVMASRSLLLTDRQEGMEELGLKHLEHCLIYDTIEEAIELAKEWSSQEKVSKRQDIAEQGWRWVLGQHTYWHRVRTMLSGLGLLY